MSTHTTLPDDERVQLLRTWLRGLPAELQIDHDSLSVASADASFRRYFRVATASAPLIVMDAPPAHEDCAPFVHIAKLFGQSGVSVPSILAEDLSQGFLLLSDLGNSTYLSALQAQPDSVPALYKDALNALIAIQKTSTTDDLPH